MPARRRFDDLVLIHHRPTTRRVGARSIAGGGRSIQVWFAVEQRGRERAVRTDRRAVARKEQRAQLGAGAVRVPRDGQRLELRRARAAISEQNQQRAAKKGIGVISRVALDVRMSPGSELCDSPQTDEDKEADWNDGLAPSHACIQTHVHMDYKTNLGACRIDRGEVLIHGSVGRVFRGPQRFAALRVGAAAKELRRDRQVG